MEEVYKSYIRYTLGILSFILGIIFMLIPFIPIGYLFIAFSILILAPKLPFLKKYIRWLKEKDKKGNLNKVERKINELEEWLTRKFAKKKEINSTPQ